MPRDIVVFGEDWGGLPSSTQHLITHLSKDRKVLWVNSIGLRQPKLCLADAKRALKKIARYLFVASAPVSTLQQADSQLTVVNPISIPAPQSSIARRISGALLAAQVLPHVKRMNLQRPIFWSSLPTAVDFLKRLQGMPSVYYCGDDFSSLAGVDHKVVKQHETDLTEKADLIVVASDALLQKFPSCKTKLLTHGVDLELFTRKAPIAEDLPKSKPLCAGFYGSLSEWLDQDLLCSVIQQNPDWNFVFIGQEHVDCSRLKGLPNTVFLGPKPHSKLVEYSQHWNVSLLPFHLSKQIHSCNPLKLKEYLAAGKPVISTDFVAARAYGSYIDIVASAEEFSVALRRSAQKNESEQLARQSAVQLDAWTRKADTIGQWIDAL